MQGADLECRVADLDDTESRASDLLAALGREGASLASIESLTGGMFASVITAVPGASASYLGGFITYASRLKHELVGVDAAHIATFGVINAATAEAMAEGGRQRTGADLAVACTGVAGPDSQDGVQAGTVFIAVASATRTTVQHLVFEGDRATIRRATVAAMVELLCSVVDPIVG